ncbi:single-strand DNA-binding protein [Microbacterium sp. BE35]|uniref:single-stranded DNA-binding protein n=1 Tax=Microbacterium sp. BE35 TaxID=2817773 RepID=UPI00285AD9A0|nr:single-stranded DNA-binding protein [Microbacterium sp. BE35]MDR7189761.1 single-strand DNA-binding protein [Microbacterium sp. BE35]
MTTIAFRGNLTDAPSLRYTQNGKPVASVTVAENVGKDDTKRTNFHRVTLWGELGENAAQLVKGTSVIVIGRLEEREYQTNEGQTRRAWDVVADAFGPDLRFATATVTRSGAAMVSAPAGDPWQSAPISDSETPF